MHRSTKVRRALTPRYPPAPAASPDTGLSRSATTPAYLPGQTTRQSELGAQLKFPLAALGYDPATQRFTVALSVPGDATADQEGTAVELIELRRKHVDFEGDSCPGQTEKGGSIRCFETTTLASRGSNPVYCQKDSNETP